MQRIKFLQSTGHSLGLSALTDYKVFAELVLWPI